MKKTFASLAHALTAALLFTFTGCGDALPTDFTLEPRDPEIAGKWRFAWTFHERYFRIDNIYPMECSAQADFTIVVPVSLMGDEPSGVIVML